MTAIESPLIADPQRHDLPALAGGKALGLQRLARAGFDPPAFFVILPDAFTTRGLRAGQKNALREKLTGLGEGPYAVRSSGIQEDGVQHSHAGQFLSILNVAAKDVAKAARNVWQSGHSGSVRQYRKSRGLEETNPAPAVIVQRMVDASASGVAFSADPVSGARNRVVISAIKGLGERLVSGEADGEDWQVDVTQGRIVVRPNAEPVLDDAQVLAVAELARNVEMAFRVPQDIEWAFMNGTLHILQARPITTALRKLPNADSQVVILDNSNIIESYPGLVSPLTYSFARYAYARVYRAFVRVVGVSEKTISDNAIVFDNMLSRVDGRVYYNLVNWYRALALLPGFSINRRHMETMMGVSEPLPQSISPAPTRGFAKLAEYSRMAKAAAGLAFQALALPRTIARFNDRLEQAIGPSSLELGSASLSELAHDYRRIESLLLDRWDAPIINDFLCMIAFGASRKLMAKWFGPEGLELHNHIMIGQGDIVSAEPARRIAAMGALVAEKPGLAERVEAYGTDAVDGDFDLKAEFDGYIAKFGDRCTEELKLESATLDENPAPLLSAIVAASRRPHHENARPAETVLNFAQVARGKPVRKLAALTLVGWAKRRVRDRENLRFERTRIFGRARKVFLAIGRELTALGHLDEARDVLFLTVEEVLGSIEGFGMTQDLRAVAALRKAEWERSGMREDPPERITVYGAAINVGVPADGAQIPVSSGEYGELQRSGTACSAGVIRSSARVIRDPVTERLSPGEILVARHTDPGWIAVFANASAIVVERGSLLSHSAIVAREMGIPCVVALKGATSWIVDGEEITVDGGSGRVERHPA